MKPLAYLQGVAAELRKVTWPTFPVLLRYFLSVLLGVIFAAAVVGGMDFIFIKLLGLLIK
jgi:preprotein translocase subunit SecE